VLELIEDSIDATENKGAQESALFQLRIHSLTIERSLHKPAQHEIDSGVYNFVTAWWELDAKEEIRKVGQNGGGNNP